MAIIDLAGPGSGQSGRAFLDRDLLAQVTVPQLEEHLRDRFMAREDNERMALIEALLRQQRALEVAVFPGEEPHPAYHAYVKDPVDPDTRLFACVLAPEPVVHAMVPPLPNTHTAFVPGNASERLDVRDFPLPEELSA